MSKVGPIGSATTLKAYKSVTVGQPGWVMVTPTDLGPVDAVQFRVGLALVLFGINPSKQVPEPSMVL